MKITTLSLLMLLMLGSTLEICVPEAIEQVTSDEFQLTRQEPLPAVDTPEEDQVWLPSEEQEDGFEEGKACYEIWAEAGGVSCANPEAINKLAAAIKRRESSANAYVMDISADQEAMGMTVRGVRKACNWVLGNAAKAAEIVAEDEDESKRYTAEQWSEWAEKCVAVFEVSDDWEEIREKALAGLKQCYSTLANTRLSLLCLATSEDADLVFDETLGAWDIGQDVVSGVLTDCRANFNRRVRLKRYASRLATLLRNMGVDIGSASEEPPSAELVQAINTCADSIDDCDYSLKRIITPFLGLMGGRGVLDIDQDLEDLIYTLGRKLAQAGDEISEEDLTLEKIEPIRKMPGERTFEKTKELKDDAEEKERLKEKREKKKERKQARKEKMEKIANMFADLTKEEIEAKKEEHKQAQMALKEKKQKLRQFMQDKILEMRQKAEDTEMNAIVSEILEKESSTGEQGEETPAEIEARRKKRIEAEASELKEFKEQMKMKMSMLKAGEDVEEIEGVVLSDEKKARKKESLAAVTQRIKKAKEDSVDMSKAEVTTDADGNTVKTITIRGREFKVIQKPDGSRSSEVEKGGRKYKSEASQDGDTKIFTTSIVEGDEEVERITKTREADGKVVEERKVGNNVETRAILPDGKVFVAKEPILTAQERETLQGLMDKIKVENIRRDTARKAGETYKYQDPLTAEEREMFQMLMQKKKDFAAGAQEQKEAELAKMEEEKQAMLQREEERKEAELSGDTTGGSDDTTQDPDNTTGGSDTPTTDTWTDKDETRLAELQRLQESQQITDVQSKELQALIEKKRRLAPRRMLVNRQQLIEQITVPRITQSSGMFAIFDMVIDGGLSSSLDCGVDTSPQDLDVALAESEMNPEGDMPDDEEQSYLLSFTILCAFLLALNL